MVTVRFFAQAAEATGCRTTSLDGATVGEVVDAAVGLFGPALAAVLATSALWVNGDTAHRATPVTDGDELAVLPPVSGG
jgi:molybdopterin converting factor small subunit